MKVMCCKDCSERHENCHAKCKKYQEQRKTEYKEDVLAAFWGDRKRKIENKWIKGKSK